MEAVKVFLCGGKASGKTVYLASLYKALSVPNAAIGLRSETSEVARNRLSRIYNRLGRGWPRGTEISEHHEIPFSFFVDTPNGSSYLGTKAIFYDYAGEAITGEATSSFYTDRMAEIGELADECDVVVSVLDGEFVYRSLFENDGDPTPELEDCIDAALHYWQSSKRLASDLRQNHYFLLTKWDLFEDDDATLDRVRDMIFSIPIIKQYVDRLNDDSVVRLIPISAVGYGFAALNPETGEMDIVSKRPQSPVNVEVPVACLIPDLVDAELARHREELEEEARRESQRQAPWWKRLIGAVGRVLERSSILRRIVHDLGVNPQAIDQLAQKLQSPELKTEQDRQLKLAEIAGQVDSEKEAAAVIHRHFANLKDSFDTRYPSSLVRG